MRPSSFDATWLCPTPDDRARVVDMEARLKPVRVLAFACLGLAMLLGIPWLGWWPLPVTTTAFVGFAAIDHYLPRSPRPEYLVAGAWVLSVGMVATGSLASGMLHSPVLCWFAIPAVTLPARFRTRGVVLGVVLILAVMLAITWGGDPTATAHNPLPLLTGAALVTSAVAFSLALMRSDLHHRGEAFIDPLTSLLTRHALMGRVAELAEQARVTRQPIALILGDIDNFKAVNDRYGHTTGDKVLKGAAERMRSELRAYDLAYRLGGEEFLIVMPGADARTAEVLAEKLRVAIAMSPISRVDVTMSFGVSASSEGQFDYQSLFTLADSALYTSKYSGRNRVCIAREGVEAVPSAQDSLRFDAAVLAESRS